MKEIRKENLIILRENLYNIIVVQYQRHPEEYLLSLTVQWSFLGITWKATDNNMLAVENILTEFTCRSAGSKKALVLNNESWFSIKSTYLQNCFSRYKQMGHSWIKGFYSLVRRIYQWILNNIFVRGELNTKFSLYPVSLPAFIKWIALQVTFRIWGINGSFLSEFLWLCEE